MPIAEADNPGDFDSKFDILLPRDRFNWQLLESRALVGAESLTAIAYRLRKYSHRGSTVQSDRFARVTNGFSYELIYQEGLNKVEVTKLEESGSERHTYSWRYNYQTNAPTNRSTRFPVSRLRQITRQSKFKPFYNVTFSDRGGLYGVKSPILEDATLNMTNGYLHFSKGWHHNSLFYHLTTHCNLMVGKIEGIGISVSTSASKYNAATSEGRELTTGQAVDLNIGGDNLQFDVMRTQEGSDVILTLGCASRLPTGVKPEFAASFNLIRDVSDVLDFVWEGHDVLALAESLRSKRKQAPFVLRESSRISLGTKSWQWLSNLTDEQSK